MYMCNKLQKMFTNLFEIIVYGKMYDKVFFY